MKTKKVILTIPLNTLDRVERMKEDMGYTTTTQVFLHALYELYSKKYGNYVPKKKETKERVSTSICSELGGKVEQENGEDVCVYNTYNLNNIYTQRVKVKDLNETHLDSQYFPDMATVKKLHRGSKNKITKK